MDAQNCVSTVDVTTNAQGQIVCTTAATRTDGNGFAAGGLTPIAHPNCVPFDPLGCGLVSDASHDYIIEDFVTKTMQRQWISNVNFGGSFFDLPAALSA